MVGHPSHQRIHLSRLCHEVGPPLIRSFLVTLIWVFFSLLVLPSGVIRGVQKSLPISAIPGSVNSTASATAHRVSKNKWFPYIGHDNLRLYLKRQRNRQ